MKLTILGTGNAKVTKCYNTCFTLNEGSEYFMIDGGGGSTILKQLEDAGISWKDISTIFVTHTFHFEKFIIRIFVTLIL